MVFASHPPFLPPITLVTIQTKRLLKKKPKDKELTKRPVLTTKPRNRAARCTWKRYRHPPARNWGSKKTLIGKGLNPPLAFATANFILSPSAAAPIPIVASTSPIAIFCSFVQPVLLHCKQKKMSLHLEITLRTCSLNSQPDFATLIFVQRRRWESQPVGFENFRSTCPWWMLLVQRSSSVHN